MRIGLVGAAAALGLAGCTGTATSDHEPTPVSVNSSESACDVAPVQAKAGTIVFSVHNTGAQATEFYLLSNDDRVIGELADIGPGVARDLVVEAQAGDYVTSCKPGMTGDGIRGDFTVTP